MRQTTRRTKYAGVHIIADFFGGKSVGNPAALQKLLYGATRESNSKPLKFVCHVFSPQGITGVVLLAESHIAVHTWPELSYIALDIFTCGKRSKPENALKFLREALQPEYVRVRKIRRGKPMSAR
ncbi:MAG: adenosylmethionine decarboxylase [Candidatus Wildermuthbacteria bacterium]|nr:adenosylmethionine decarboxylase [Candidatus Wildermuthbacteria bacterium]